MPLPRARLREIDAQFNRVFSGDGWPDDLRDLATKYGCTVVVVTALDGAWARDPFATERHWRLVESERAGLAHLRRRRSRAGGAVDRAATARCAS